MRDARMRRPEEERRAERRVRVSERKLEHTN